jgi:hypothetical protein
MRGEEYKLSNYLYDYFYNLDDPPVDRLIVPADKIRINKNQTFTEATLVYITESGSGEKVHVVRIEFDKNKLDSNKLVFNYI